VANTIALEGDSLDAPTRMQLIVSMHWIQRGDLPEDLQPLYDEFRTYLGMA
jgi:hypothetical protein